MSYEYLDTLCLYINIEFMCNLAAWHFIGLCDYQVYHMSLLSNTRYNKIRSMFLEIEQLS